MRFSYYARLSASGKRIYRRSDEIRGIDIPDAVALAPHVVELSRSLFAGKRLEVQRAASALALALGLAAQLDVPPVRVLVRATRPDG